VDVKDLYGKWYEAWYDAHVCDYVFPSLLVMHHVSRYEADCLQVDHVTCKILVHYHGWATKWDEWLDRSSDRFAPRNRHSVVKKTSKKEKHKKHVNMGEMKRPVQTQQWCRRFQIEYSQDETSTSLTCTHVGDMYLRTKCDALTYDSCHDIIWGYCADGNLEMWRLPTTPIKHHMASHNNNLDMMSSTGLVAHDTTSVLNTFSSITCLSAAVE